jgi:hypothetical protein
MHASSHPTIPCWSGGGYTPVHNRVHPHKLKQHTARRRLRAVVSGCKRPAANQCMAAVAPLCLPCTRDQPRRAKQGLHPLPPCNMHAVRYNTSPKAAAATHNLGAYRSRGKAQRAWPPAGVYSGPSTPALSPQPRGVVTCQAVQQRVAQVRLAAGHPPLRHWGRGWPLPCAGDLAAHTGLSLMVNIPQQVGGGALCTWALQGLPRLEGPTDPSSLEGCWCTGLLHPPP